MSQKPFDFQTMISRLQEFWAQQGCLIWQPYYSQVGAGTYNPATILRVLGPEPWSVGYVEPSVRPDDGRYGENPNRLQMHYQYQVILKPDPGNPQELYLQSLEALGIDPRQHDIRFVEDNWESPALGAWGLGWEVWLDGQEITQFTYFQQAGGFTLDPVSVEITYGLDRIAISLQRVSHFKDIRWNKDLTYGDVNLLAEQEHSRYYFDMADVDRTRQMYELFEKEALACLEDGMVLPALDYILKCSHTFNILDARGVIGVTERQAFFGRMRELSRRVSETYLEQRQRMEYPWLDDAMAGSGVDAPATTSNTGLSDQDEGLPMVAAPFLLEIGTEELPVGDLESALEQLRSRMPELMSELRLAHGEVSIMGTPRRLSVYVKELVPFQPDQESEFRGPPADRAFGPGGEPTKAAEGFARSKGVAVDDLLVREMDGGRYVVAVVQEVGRPAVEVLADALPGLIAGLKFDRPMRWNHSNVFFSRPLRWLLALFGEQVVPFEYAGVVSDRLTRGLRFHEPESVHIQNIEEYFRFLSSQGILLDFDERQTAILNQVESLAEEMGGSIALPGKVDSELLAEVTNLVETPTALRGTFPEEYLELPDEVLISVMKKHQRYFPVYASSERASQPGKKEKRELLPYFIAVRNGAPLNGVDQDMDLVVEGNEHVIQARFSDASFFVRHDREQPLENYLPRLGTLIFQTRLGSMLDKSRRLVKLVEVLAPMVGLSGEQTTTTRRAAELCKADLVTQMVIEMTSLQGIMGRYYALDSGESPEVADAIAGHYLPRFAGDEVPPTKIALVVGLADRVDSLAGLFSAGLAPSGNKDPFGQRRTALGLVQSLMSWGLDFDLRHALGLAADLLPIEADPQLIQAAIIFITERLRNILLEDGSRYDVVDAVLAEQGHNPAQAFLAVKQLQQWVKREDWMTILPAYSRCVRITRPVAQAFSVKPELLVEDEEQALWDGLKSVEAVPRQEGSVDDFLNNFILVIPPINRFFDKVLVMAEDETLRANRLGLLQRIVRLAKGTADLSRLEGF